MCAQVGASFIYWPGNEDLVLVHRGHPGRRRVRRPEEGQLLPRAQERQLRLGLGNAIGFGPEFEKQVEVKYAKK